MGNKKKQTDSSDIARIAGVSRCTVSKVINGYSDVGEETRKKVLTVIEELGYSPNLAGRLLAGKGVETIGLFFIIQQDAPYSFSEDTITDQMLATVADTASERNYLTLTTIIRVMDSFSENRIREIFYQNRIDGGIFIGARSNEPVVEELVSRGFPVAVLDYNCPENQEENRLIANYDPDVGEHAVDYLVSKGFTDIMAVHGNIQRYDGYRKYKSFIKGMEKHSLPLKEGWSLFAEFNLHEAYQKTYTFLSSTKILPEAVFCANDHIAYGFLQASRELEIKVPEDIAVIGIDDALPSRYCSPALTTFRVDFGHILRSLTMKLIETIKSETDEPYYQEFKSTLVERNSC